MAKRALNLGIDILEVNMKLSDATKEILDLALSGNIQKATRYDMIMALVELAPLLKEEIKKDGK
jgi:hypothetical protein